MPLAQTQTRPPSAGWVLLLGTPVPAWAVPGTVLAGLRTAGTAVTSLVLLGR